MYVPHYFSLNIQIAPTMVEYFMLDRPSMTTATCGKQCHCLHTVDVSVSFDCVCLLVVLSAVDHSIFESS